MTMPIRISLTLACIFMIFVACANYLPLATAIPPATPISHELTRGEVAPLIVELYTAGTGQIPPVVACPFTDIGDLPPSQHDAVCQLWGVKVVVGTVRDQTYSPELPFSLFAQDYLTQLAAAIERDS